MSRHDDDTREIPKSQPPPGLVVSRQSKAQHARDWTCIIVGAASLISQIVFQALDIEPNILLVSAGCALLGAPAFFRIGDRRNDT